MNLLSKLLPPKIAEAVVALVGTGLTIAVSIWGNANHWVQIALGVATFLGVGGTANALTERRAAKAAAKAPAKAA